MSKLSPDSMIENAISPWEPSPEHERQRLYGPPAENKGLAQWVSESSEEVERIQPTVVASAAERYQIGEMIQCPKAKANFYAFTMKGHPTDGFATLGELITLANGFQGAASLDPSMLHHPYVVIREYALKRLKQANRIIDIKE